jgi:hypothetical protein
MNLLFVRVAAQPCQASGTRPSRCEACGARRDDDHPVQRVALSGRVAEDGTADRVAGIVEQWQGRHARAAKEEDIGGRLHHRQRQTLGGSMLGNPAL